MKALDIEGNEIVRGDVIEVAHNPKPFHPWLHEGNKLVVSRIEDRSFQGEEEYLVVFLRTLKGRRVLEQGIKAEQVRVVREEE